MFTLPMMLIKAGGINKLPRMFFPFLFSSPPPLPLSLSLSLSLSLFFPPSSFSLFFPCFFYFAASLRRRVRARVLRALP